MALKKNWKVDLKAKYKRTFEISMIIALVILVSAFKFFPSFTAEAVELEAPQELVEMQDVEQTKQEAAPPPPPNSGNVEEK